MRRRFPLRIGIVAAVIVGSLLYLYPPPFARSYLYGPAAPAARPGGILPSTLNLGLDLQGGIHLVLGVDLDKAIEAQVERAGSGIRSSLEKKGIAVKGIQRRGPTELVVELASPEAWAAAQSTFGELAIFETKEADQAAGRVVLLLRAKEGAALRDLAVRQGLETIRNRVDQFGVSEPSIQQQGENRILIQLPGVQDPERAKALIGKTALLEFKLLDESADVDRAVKEGPPEGDEVLYQRRVDKETKQERRIPFVVQKKTLLTGADLSTARVSIDQTTSEPYVSVELNAAGAKAFADLTEANVNKRLAIILDGNVHSAPVIRERIPSGQAQITGGFTTEEATDLAIVLRAGALPAPVQVLEERTVGPSLGADSIRQGIIAILASTALVCLFMLVYYRLSGLIANVALGLNLLVLLAVMAGFHATLTLPGIAGIALTVGMAVDTNILIFERIREELRSGKTVRAAIGAGFTRAFKTVVDTHVTVLVSGLILYQFGTGPVKGFAVSLMIGILASLFTAVFFTRLLFDLIYTTSRKVASISI
ncbi:MAG: protein-export membrane protein SecD [Candidatus Rokubacteria bacterium GWC2_70_24]|nr:MAG: protein-export membrane protein SecD [Candidatus Rokubacteria bacterium GWA2_70_23]OGK91261.1 MAG: protein-export membrane protein SecD [Candidatus Rokubacteria bacterium GWC2_70_24]